MPLHELTEQGACTRCGLAVHGSARRWASDCPGVPWYAWERIPPELVTRTTLAREGLRLAPGQGPAGYYVAWEYRAYRLLYDRGQAIAKRAPASERERTARAEGARRLLALRTCEGCGKVQRSRRALTSTGDGPGAQRLCAPCYETWEWRASLAALYAAAREILADATREGGRRALVLDTETTGLDEGDEPIELAIVDALSGAVLLDTRLRPSVPISPEAQAVHGITAGELAQAPALADVWPRYRELTRGALVIAYNAPFDRRMMRQAAARYGLNRPGCQWYCLMDACAILDPFGEGRWQSLESAYYLSGAYKTASEGEGPAHRARADALAARAVLHALAAQAESPQGASGSPASSTAPAEPDAIEGPSGDALADV